MPLPNARGARCASSSPGGRRAPPGEELARGFTLVRDAAGRPLRSAAAVTAGAPIEIEFADGRVGAHVDDTTSTTKPSGEVVKRPRRGGGSNQGNLF